MIDPELAKLVAGVIALVASVVAIARLSVLALARAFDRVLSQQAEREIANREVEELFRRRLLDQQERITIVMDNHMGTIAANQARTAQSLELIVSRLLDAAVDPGREEFRGEPR